MIYFNQDLVFILKRTKYKEQHYLVDILHREYGRFHASARIPTNKGHRQTNNFAYFQEVCIDGYRRHELANIHHAEICTPMILSTKQQLYAHYLNELILRYLPIDDPAPLLYDVYKQSIALTDPIAFRLFEYRLLEHLGLIPELSTDSAYYKLDVHNGAIQFCPATTGFPRALVLLLIYGERTIFCQQKQAKMLLQAILAQIKPLPIQTRNVALALEQLISI